MEAKISISVPMVHATCSECSCDFGYRTRGVRGYVQRKCQLCKVIRPKKSSSCVKKVKGVCGHCLSEFWGRNGQKWCSKKCITVKRHAEERVLGGTKRKCLQCGIQTRGGQICSDECRIARWSRKCNDCDAEYVQKKNTSGKCGRCRKKDRERASSVRLRVRRGKVRVAVNKLSVREVFDKDGGRCQVCKKAINWDLSWPHKMSMSVDHIVPLSKGGSDEAENVQAAHLGCNSRKSDKSGSQKRLFG